jgi:hypothetical protein
MNQWYHLLTLWFWYPILTGFTRFFCYTSCTVVRPTFCSSPILAAANAQAMTVGRRCPTIE